MEIKGFSSTRDLFFNDTYIPSFLIGGILKGAALFPLKTSLLRGDCVFAL
jgi:hypothetical protein